MLNKSLLLILILLLSHSCRNVTERNLLEKKVFNVVDSMSSSFPKEYPVNLFTVTHQRLDGKDYIKVSTAEFFNKDSVSNIKFNNQKLIVYYSKNFFKKKQENLSSYKNYEYTPSTISLYHPRYVVFEILKDSTYKNISLEKSIEMNLFTYGDRYIPEPVPNK